MMASALSYNVKEIISVLVLIAIGAFMIWQLISAVGVNAPAWFNNTMNNITNLFTSSLVPIVGLVIVVVLIAIAWAYYNSSMGGGMGGKGQY
jgi:membrane protease YdiL (CAAX protease family)